MRTTIDLDDELLMTARELARQQRSTLGKVVSSLLREALTGAHSAAAAEEPSVAGFRPFAAQERIVTNTVIDTLRDEEAV